MLRKSKKFLIYFLVFSFIFVLLFQPLLVNKASAYIRPTLNLNIPSQPKIGDEMKIRVMAMYSDEKEPTRIGYSYYISGFPGAGLIAGSQDQFRKDASDKIVLGNQYGNLKYIDYESIFGHKIRYWYRTILNSEGESKEPWEDNDKDVNHNKIHDDWERRYFGIDPATDKVDPDADPDDDDYIWLERMKNAHGGCMIFSMPEVTHCALYGFPGEICLHKALFDAGIPQTADVGPGGIIDSLSPRYGIGTDNKFSNYEEYVFGTNPKLADTDGDGILDEADIIGLGQDECNFKITPALGPAGNKFPVEVKTLGYVLQGKGNFHEWRAMGGFFDFSCLLLLSKTSTVVVSPGPPLNIILQSEPKVPTLANNGTDYPEVKVEASVTGMEHKQRLYFKWYIGTKVQDEGYGKNKFSFPVTADPCSVVPVICDVSEESPGGVVRSGSTNLDIPIGYNISENALSASLLYNISQDQDGDGCIDGDTNCNFILEGGETWTTTDPFHDQINSDLLDNGRNVRQNDVIKIQTEFSKDNGLCTLGDSDEPKDFIYNWYLDGKEQTDQSGAGDKPNPQIEGGTFQDFQFTVTKPPGDTHLVKLKLIRITDGFEYGQLGEKVFTVVGPEIGGREVANKEEWISFDDKGTDSTYDSETQSDGTTIHTITLASGQTMEVTLDSVLKNFRPTHSGVTSFHYYWTINGDSSIDNISLLDYTNCAADEKKGTYCETLRAEKSITIPFNYVEGGEETTYTLTLKVDNLIDEDTSVDESATRSAIVKIKYEAGGIGRGPVTRLFAQAGGAISSYFRNIFNIVLSIGIIGFIVFIVMAAGEVRRRK